MDGFLVSIYPERRKARDGDPFYSTLKTIVCVSQSPSLPMEL